MIDSYFQELQNLITATSFITAASLHTERRSETIGFVRGDLTFTDGSRLHFREFVLKDDEPAERYTYVYHYQSSEGQLLFRYDNTNHYPSLSNAPHHKHISESEVIAVQEPELLSVLKEIADHLAF